MEDQDGEQPRDDRERRHDQAPFHRHLHRFRASARRSVSGFETFRRPARLSLREARAAAGGERAAPARRVTTRLPVRSLTSTISVS